MASVHPGIKAYLEALTKGTISHPGPNATPEEILKSAKAAGFEFTIEELAAHGGDDSDLDAGGGGSCYFNTGDMHL